jgi:mono/diheme cytochrome c family protein
MTRLLTLTATALLLVTLVATTGRTQGFTSNTWDGVFTEEQAERGMALAETNCVMCHAANLRGGPGAPPIAGSEFLFVWSTQSVNSLFEYLKLNMPPVDPGGLSDQEYTDIVAAILSSSGFPAGETELPTEGLSSIQILRTQPQ